MSTEGNAQANQYLRAVTHESHLIRQLSEPAFSLTNQTSVSTSTSLHAQHTYDTNKRFSHVLHFVYFSYEQ